MDVFGLVGSINMVGGFVAWIKLVKPAIPTNTYYFYWFAWFAAIVLQELAWSFVAVVWPLTPICEPFLLTVMDYWLRFITYGGVYGTYEVLLTLILISVFAPGGGWSFDQRKTAIATIGYSLVAVIDGLASWYLYPVWHDWYENEMKIIQAKIEAQKEANGGKVVSAQNTSDGPIVFNNGQASSIGSGTTIEVTSTLASMVVEF